MPPPIAGGNHRRTAGKVQMDERTHIVGASSGEHTSHAQDFYRDYWHVGGGVSETTSLRNQAFLKAFFATPPAGKCILEIGIGGEGGLVLGLKETNDVYGLDASETAVKGSTGLGIRTQLYDADRNAIPFPGDSFDIVMAFEMMEHLSNPQFAIEEIRRVLKPGGRLIVSTPSSYTHHWPRFFYPSLIARDGFRKFLLSNRLWVSQELGFGENRYAAIVTDPRDRAWSDIWICENARNDANRLVEMGWHLLNQKDENGVRVFPMEAVELLRGAVELDPLHIEALGGLGLGLVYRVLNNELTEFTETIQRLEAAVDSGNRDAALAASFRLVIVHAELARFGKRLFPEDRCNALVAAVASANNPAGDMLIAILEDSSAFALRLGGKR
jgi:SAM-dependent methyltransferase